MKLIKLPPLSNTPLVSIIVPSYNQGAFIQQTLDSILEQDYRPLEVLVIDGASTDNTLDVLHQYDNVPEVSWISESDSGQIEAVNKGFQRANGEVGAIQSSDDFYLPGAVKLGVEALTVDPTLGFVFGDIIKVDVEGNELFRTHLRPFSLENVLSVQTWVPQPSTFFRLDLAKSLGCWREEVSYAADTDLWLRMAFRARAKKLDVIMAKRTMHDEQRDKQGARIIRDYSQVINDLFDHFGAPEELRPMAEAGILLQTNRYSYTEPETVKLQRLKEAVRIYPPLRKHLFIPSPIPGLDKARSIASSIKSLFSNYLA